jgi:hypothetical protein
MTPFLDFSYNHSWASASRHRYSGINNFSPVLEDSGTGLGLLVPVTESFQHRNFFSFWYQTDWMPISLALRHSKKLYERR